MSAEPQGNNNGGARRFRLQGKNFLVTWPQCNERKEVVLERAREFFGDSLEFAVVSHEEHADGSPHLHAMFAMNRKKTYCRADCFDSLANSHGNYQVARSQRAAVKYVTKDGDFTSHGVDVGEYLQAADSKQSTKATLMATKLQQGSTLQELNAEDPGFVMMNQRKLKEYQALIAVWMDTPTKAWTPISVNPLTMPMTMTRLASWLNKNLGESRVLRQKQLLLSSPPGMGKTTMIEALRRYFRVYDQMGDKWFDGFDPLHHEIIVFDEFQGKVELSIMNKVLDGQRCLLQTKGGSVQKVRNIPVIILTNYTNERLYSGENVASCVREAFFSRLLYLRLEEGEEPWKWLPFISDTDAEGSSSEVEDDEEVLDFSGSVGSSDVLAFSD